MHRLTVRGLSQACATTAFTAMGLPEEEAGAQASGMAADMNQETSAQLEVTGCSAHTPNTTGASDLSQMKFTDTCMVLVCEFQE